MNKEKMPLDELEVAIQLVLKAYPKMCNATYRDLARLIELEFKQTVEERDIFLIYEPNIDEEQRAMEDYYGSMYDLTKDIY